MNKYYLRRLETILEVSWQKENKALHAFNAVRQFGIIILPNH